jgi:predicted RNase H-like HicB family nuclease
MRRWGQNRVVLSLNQIKNLFLCKFCGILMPEVRVMKNNYQLPIIVEKDEDGFYVVECPLFSGCYTQGKTIDEALKNIREVIELCLKEKENLQMLKEFHPQEISFHTLTYA